MSRRDSLTPYRSTRRKLYEIARIMGDVQPWLEMSPRKLIRRYVHRYLGRISGRFLFGRGRVGSIVRHLLGL